MDSTQRTDPLYSPVPGRALPADNPQHLSPWRNRVAAVTLLTVAIVALALAIFVL